MIGKAAHLINQLNELIEGLDKNENPEHIKVKFQLSEINNSIQHLKAGGLTIPSDLLKLKEKYESEKNEFEPSEEILAYIRDQIILTISKIDRVGTNKIKMREMKKPHTIRMHSNNESITENEWMEISSAEKMQYKMEYDGGTITLTDIFGKLHKCKTLNTLKRHERGE